MKSSVTVWPGPNDEALIDREGLRMTTSMMAATVEGPRHVELREAAVPSPKPDEVLVCLEGCGVCGSSVPTWTGRPWFQYPMAAGAPGHEGWGHVVARGQGVRTVKEGDRVAMLSYRAFAEFDLARAADVVVLPPSLRGRDVPGEALACVMNIFARSGIREGDKVAVVGVGFLGALLVQLARRAGAEVVAVSRRVHALGVAESMGARRSVTLGGDAERVEEAVCQAGGEGFDVVIEAAGHQAALDLATRLCRVGGRLVIAGFHQDGGRQVDLCAWNWRALEIVNAHTRAAASYVEGLVKAVRAVEEGTLVPDELYTHRLPIARLADALDLLVERPRGFMKANVVMDASV